MSNLMEIIKSRRSTRAFQSELPPKDQIMQLVEAAEWAPSGMSKYLWHFAVVYSAEKSLTLAKAVAEADNRGPDYNFYGAPVNIIISYKRDEHHALVDGAAAMENLLLMATELGLGSCWINQLRECCDDPKVRAADRVRRAGGSHCRLLRSGRLHRQGNPGKAPQGGSGVVHRIKERTRMRKGGNLMDAQIAKLKEWVDASDNIVFFGGAGVSTESGIPDFRSVDGLYNQQYKYPPETILSHSFFISEPEEFYRFYRAKMLALDAEPNAAHLKLAEWERMGKCRAVVTQNIDGLHQKAGSKEVLELHGSVLRNYCMRCHKPYDVRDIAAGTGVPKCSCGGTIKPDVVLYEESLDSYTINKSVDYIRKADILIIGGTSLAVYPAASLINYYRGNKLVLVNKSATPADRSADLVIHKPIGEVFSQL